MNLNHFGWILLIGGGLLSLAEGVAVADTNATGVAYEQTAIGKIEAAIPNPTPLELGTILLVAGAAILWVVPYARKKL